MRASVAQLKSESVLKSLARDDSVSVQQRRKAPQHGIAVPVCGRDVVARAARSHPDKLLCIDGATPRIEGGEDQVAIHQGVESRVARAARMLCAPRRSL